MTVSFNIILRYNEDVNKGDGDDNNYFYEEACFMANLELKKTAKAAKIPFWRIAEAMGISETAMSRKMRHELTEQERQEVLATIAKLQMANEA